MFSLTTDDRLRSKGLKLQQRRLKLDFRKNFRPARVVKHWDKWPTGGCGISVNWKFLRRGEK